MYDFNAPKTLTEATQRIQRAMAALEDARAAADLALPDTPWLQLAWLRSRVSVAESVLAHERTMYSMARKKGVL